MDGEGAALHIDGFATPHASALTPLRLALPEPLKTISCGRKHAVGLSQKSSHLWVITSWGRPFRLITPHLDNSSPESKITQVEAGWDSVSVLTETGNVFMLWPLDGQIGELVQLHHEQQDEEEVNAQGNGQDKTISATEDGIIPCRPWVLDLGTSNNDAEIQARTELLLLPPLPSDLPELLNDDAAETSRESSSIKLVKVAVGADFIVGLTNHGHVLKMNLTTGHPMGGRNRAETLREEFRFRRREWEYLPLFSETEHVRNHPTFASQQDLSQNRAQEQSTLANTANIDISPPDVLKINHISANFKTFFAYSTGTSSVVLTGKQNSDGTTTREILPTLQNRGVIAVTLGDYTFGALTSEGELLTWGKYQAGSLGLGEPSEIEVGKPGGFATEEQRLRSGEWTMTPPEVTVPTAVKFGKGGKKFCFAAVAAGWHFGALVLSLDGKADEEDQEVKVATPHDEPRMPGGFHGEPGPHHHRLPIRGVPIMRIGFAGRGRGMGGGRGGGGGPARGQIPDELN